MVGHDEAATVPYSPGNMGAKETVTVGANQAITVEVERG